MRVAPVLLALVLVLAAVPAAFAAVGDGVCDQSDLLKNSPDCSPAVFVLTDSGGPLETLRLVVNGSHSAIVTLLVRNYADKPGIVCVSPAGNISLYTNEGEEDTICTSVSAKGETYMSFGIKYPEDVTVGTVVGYVSIVTAYGSRDVPVYVIVAPSSGPLANPEVATIVALLIFAFVVWIVSRSRR